MSVEAMSWVLKQDISRSSEKFILICLANYADERGICYPSTELLVRNTGQDRKTVMLNIKRLIECGHLADTGHRVGRTKSVPVYELVGMPGNSAVHYVYRTTDLATGEFYIGKRSFNGDPALDTYYGSGRWVIAAQRKGVKLHKEMLESFDTDVEARAAEVRLFKELGEDALCRNEASPAALRNYFKSPPRNEDSPPDQSDTDNGTPSEDGQSSAVFSESSTNFSASGTVFPAKQAQKRDIEPLSKRKRTTKEPGARGTRLPANWVLPKSWGLKALADPDLPGWTEEHVRLEARKFFNHWTALSGSRGIKLNWELTWQNWCLKADGPRVAAAARGPAWWTSEELKLAKGVELGMTPNLGENMFTFEQRLRAAIANGGKEPPPPRQSRVGIMPPSGPVGTLTPEVRAELKKLTGRTGPAPRPTNPNPDEDSKE